VKFTLVKNIQTNSVMSLILKGFLVFVLLYLISNILVMDSSFGISVESVSTTLFGNEDEYIDPITESTFLEFWHTEIFFIMMILFTISAIFIRVSKRSRMILTNLLMVSALLSLIALPLAYYISDFFVNVYVFAFFSWHAMATYIILYSFWKLNAKSI